MTDEPRWPRQIGTTDYYVGVDNPHTASILVYGRIQVNLAQLTDPDSHRAIDLMERDIKAQLEYNKNELFAEVAEQTAMARAYVQAEGLPGL